MEINKMTTAGFSIAVDPEFTSQSSFGCQKLVDNVTENVFLKGKKLNPVGSFNNSQRKAFGDINGNCLPTQSDFDSIGKSSQLDCGSIAKPWQNKQQQKISSQTKSDFVIMVDTPADQQLVPVTTQVSNTLDNSSIGLSDVHVDDMTALVATSSTELTPENVESIVEDVTNEVSNDNTANIMDVVTDTDTAGEESVPLEVIDSSDVLGDYMDVVDECRTLSENDATMLPIKEHPESIDTVPESVLQEGQLSLAVETSFLDSNIHDEIQVNELKAVEDEQSTEDSQEQEENREKEIKQDEALETINMSTELLVYDSVYDLSELICITENPIMTKTLKQAFYEETPCLVIESVLDQDQANISSISAHSVAELLSDRQWDDLAFELPPLEFDLDNATANAAEEGEGEGVTDGYLFGCDDSFIQELNTGEGSLEDGEIRELLPSAVEEINEDIGNTPNDDVLIPTVEAVEIPSLLDLSLHTPMEAVVQELEALEILCQLVEHVEEEVVEMDCLEEKVEQEQSPMEQLEPDATVEAITVQVVEPPVEEEIINSTEAIVESIQQPPPPNNTDELLLIEQLEGQRCELQAEVAQCRVELEQYRLELDDSLAQSQSLEEQLIVKDQEFARLMSQLSAEKEDSMIAKTQTRALSHRLAAVEKELEENKQLNINNVSALEARNQEIVKRMIAEHSMAISSQEQAMSQTHSKQVAMYQQQIVELQKQLGSNQEIHLAELNKAINDTKAKVYDKVKTQFDAGNKEYQKVTAQLKECLLERDLAKRQLDQKEGLINNIQVQVSNDKQVKDSMMSKLQSMCSGTQHIINILTSNASLVSATSNGPAPDSLLFLLTAINTITDTSKQRMEELHTCRSQRDSLKSVADTMETSLRRLETETIPHLQQRTQQQEDRANISEGLLGTVRVDLAEAVRERDMQMTVVAKLATQNEALQQQVQGLTKEVDNSKEKLSKLHFMNVDLVNMLGKLIYDSITVTVRV